MFPWCWHLFILFRDFKHKTKIYSNHVLGAIGGIDVGDTIDYGGNIDFGENIETIDDENIDFGDNIDYGDEQTIDFGDNISSEIKIEEGKTQCAISYHIKKFFFLYIPSFIGSK